MSVDYSASLIYGFPLNDIIEEKILDRLPKGLSYIDSGNCYSSDGLIRYICINKLTKTCDFYCVPEKFDILKLSPKSPILKNLQNSAISYNVPLDKIGWYMTWMIS